MGILRGVSSRVLPCGCLAGIYETYDGAIVTLVDARGQTCADPAHVEGNELPSPAGSAPTVPPAPHVRPSPIE